MQAAEVGLINRNILVTSTQEAPPNQLQGGHVIIYETKAKQEIVGVEFSYLGQQGTLGRWGLIQTCRSRGCISHSEEAVAPEPLFCSLPAWANSHAHMKGPHVGTLCISTCAARCPTMSFARTASTTRCSAATMCTPRTT